MIAARQIAFGGGSKRKPYDAEIEYLESTGTQYIDLGLNSTADKFCDFDITFKMISGAIAPFGYQYGATARYGIWGRNPHSIGINNTVYAQYDIGLEKVAISVRNGQYVEVNGVRTTIGAGSVRANIGMALFTRNSGYSGLTVNGYSIAQVFAFKIWSTDGVLLLDLIPVRKGNIGYMYDRVSGQLFGNQGTGEFVLGPDIIGYTAKDYVQNGLVAMWDGIENVGFGEPHDSSVTTWKNLAGGKDIEIYTQNAEWNDSALVGKERHFVNASTVLGLGTLAMPSTYETVEVVINSYDNSSIWVLFMHGSPMSTSHVALANHDRGLQFAYVNGLGGGIYIDDLPTEGVRFGAARVGTSPSQEGGECYLNGLPYTRSFPRANLSAVARFGEGFRTSESNATPFVGEVCAMRFYSRALTAEEIAHNYNIDKVRFGL